MTESITAVLQRMKHQQETPGGGQLVSDWQKQIPSWSHWSPGSVGDPYCEKCLGTGYVRVDVAIGHPMFGRAYFCECVPQSKIIQHEAYLAEKGRK